MAQVQHQPEQQRFVLVENPNQAQLLYRLFERDGIAAIDFTSTYVAPELRGSGVAEALVRAGLAWAKAQGYELHASCWYAAKFIR